MRQRNLKEGRVLGQGTCILVSRPCLIQLQRQDPNYISQSASAARGIVILQPTPYRPVRP